MASFSLSTHCLISHHFVSSVLVFRDIQLTLFISVPLSSFFPPSLYPSIPPSQSEKILAGSTLFAGSAASSAVNLVKSLPSQAGAFGFVDLASGVFHKAGASSAVSNVLGTSGCFCPVRTLTSLSCALVAVLT